MPIEGCPDYATKNELQELRDQLNAALGEKEEGGSEDLFVKDKAPDLVKAGLAITLLGTTKVRAANAIVDLAINNPAFEPIYRDFANGNAKWAKVKANGTRTPLPNLTAQGKVAGQGAAAGGAGAKVASVGAAGLAVLASLVQIAATLALNIATVKVIDKRIDAEARGTQVALDAMNNGMLRLYEKNQGDINAANAEIQATNEAVAINRQNIEVTKSEIQEVTNINADLSDQLNDAQQTIENLRTQNLETSGFIEDLQLDIETISSDLTSSITQVSSELDNALSIIQTQKADIEKTNEQVVLVEEKIAEIDLRITAVELETAQLREDFETLREDLTVDPELAEARSKLKSALLIIGQEKAIKSGGGGSSLPAVNTAANTQTAMLELASKLTEFNPDTPTITKEDIYNNTSTFETTFNELLPQLSSGGEVNQAQIDGLESNLKTAFKDELGIAIGTLLVPDLVTLKDRTTERKLADATKKGICESLNGGSCPITPENPNPTQGLEGMKNALSNKMDEVNASLNLTAVTQNNTIKSIVQNTNDVINHSQYGLAKIQNFAETAWKATRADKILQFISTAAVLHNAMMLSRNIGGSIGDAISAIANNTVSFLKNEESNSIDINSAIGTTLEGAITAIIGAENYTEASQTLAKYSRTVNSASNVIYSMTSIQAGLAQGMQTIGNYTGKIGNALKKSGAVLENSYPFMSENTNIKTGRLGQIQAIIDGGEQVENFASEIQNATSEFREAQENVNNIGNEFNKVKEDFSSKEAGLAQQEAIAKANSQAAQPTLADLVRDPIEE